MFKIKNPIPARSVGIGLRHPHHNFVLENKPDVHWLEVHSENFFAEGGLSLNILKNIRKNYPISLHGVGLSLGSVQKPDKTHLKKLKNLIKFIDPFLVSDHISWSNINGKVLNDLLPIPYTFESLKFLCQNINETQNFLQRQILVENPSSYLTFKESEIAEYDFINQVAQKTGCKILLDINNIFVSSQNNIFDPIKYIEKIKPEIVGEIHLAGHSKFNIEEKIILIDTHDDYVCNEVWNLYRIAIKKINAPTLIEWDQNLPAFEALLNESEKAKIIIKENELT